MAGKSKKQRYEQLGSVKLKRKINGEEEVARWIDETTKEELGIIEYKTGIGLNPAEYEESISTAQKEQQRQNDMKCRSCGELGHYNKQNFMCRLNKINQKNAAKYAETLQGKNKEQDVLPPPLPVASTAAQRDWHSKNYGGSSPGTPGSTHGRLEAREALDHDCVPQREVSLPVAPRQTAAVNTSLCDIHSKEYESTAYAGTGEQHVQGTGCVLLSGEPPVTFLNDTYVDDTEDDDVLAADLIENLKMLVLHHDDEWAN